MLASSALRVCVTHVQVHPVWDETVPALAFVASFAVGTALLAAVVRPQQGRAAEDGLSRHH